MPRLFLPICLALLVLTSGTARGQASQARPRTAAEILLDAARDLGLSRGTNPDARDIRRVRLLLRGATRLDPALQEAHAYLYELATLAGDRPAANQAVNDLLRADPTHEGAFMLWLQAGAAAQQTAEKRIAWLESVARTRRPPALLAHVQVELARVALEQIDLPRARRHIAAALELEPACVDAAALATAALDADAPPEERLAAALRHVQLAPLAVRAAWQAATVLDEYGFVDDAGRFFDYALETQRRAFTGEPLPGAFLLALARNTAARGSFDAAIERVREAILADPSVAAEGGMLLWYLHHSRGDAQAETIRAELGHRYAATRDPNTLVTNELAQGAWFLVTIGAEPDRGLAWAEQAARRVRDDDFVRRVLGWAQWVAGQTDTALTTLTPVAGRDPYAAYVVARIRLAAGDSAGAAATIAQLDPPPFSGAAADLISELESAIAAGTGSDLAAPTILAATTRPVARPPAEAPAQRYPAIRAALDRFDARVFDFVREPAAFVDARIELAGAEVRPGQPWWVRCTLVNRGPLAITLGPGAMLNPVFVLSFTVDGQPPRTYPGLMTVSVDQSLVLRPGQSASAVRTLDVGPLRGVARGTPQRSERVAISAIVDGTLGTDGQWRPSPTGLVVRQPAYLARVPATVQPAAVQQLTAGLRSSDPAVRARCIDVAADLLGERQRAALRRSGYALEPVPAEQLEQGLVAALADASWEVRLRALDALQPVGLTRGLLAAAEACLDHEHWAVRLLAVRLAARQGAAARDVIGRIARTDADELVRDYAQSFVEQWTIEPPQ
ncbi:MAG: HEAT repeat domain-containing protein [Phycisphaerales bacterium]|nr:HEAT repeat domain-containing protein [Phycisphaerales bacterium]